jgi:hypothetical protein
MKKLILILLLLAVRVVGAEFYVSPNGSDSNAGTKAKPFATIEAARDAVRELARPLKQPVNVWVRGGRYFMDDTFVLTPADSGSYDAAITYAAFPGETPVFLGSRLVEGWKKLTEDVPGVHPNAKGKLWFADIDKGWKFHFMYVDGQPAQRSRSVNHDNWRQWGAWKKDFIASEPDKQGTVVTFTDKGLLKDLPSNGDVEMFAILMQYGVIGNGILKEINPDNGTARWNSNQVNLNYGGRDNEKHFRLENALAFIDVPGQWAVDSQKGRIYYWPLLNDMKNCEVLVTKLNQLVRFQGSSQEKKWVHHIDLRGLTFKHTDRLPEDKWPRWWLKRQWENPNAVIFMQDTHDCAIVGNRILYSGSYGITLCHYSQHIDIRGNEIGFTGSGGVFLWGYGPGLIDVNHHNTIVQNYIHDHGLANYWHSPSIQIYQSGSNVIEYNLLKYSAYNGISIVGADNGRAFALDRLEGCWEGQVDKHDMFKPRWDSLPQDVIQKLKGGWKPNNMEMKQYLHSRNNNIAYNVIVEPHSKLNEGGAIHAWWCGKDNIWKKNLAYKNGQMPGSSIFALDDRAEYVTVQGNVAWIQGKILNLVGARPSETGNVINGNVRVYFKPEWISRDKVNIGHWWVNRDGRKEFDWLYREIRTQVDNLGGWLGDPDVGLPGFGSAIDPEKSNLEHQLPKDMRTLY